jgi:hypothetical protein
MILRDFEMNGMNKNTAFRARQSGQTLIIAILILGVLLILGIAFAGIINRNISETGRSARRTVAGDLSQAGIKYAHAQMLNSAMGADWRPELSPVSFDVAGFTKDPDALYLRPGTGFFVEVDPVNRPGYTVPDLGGPDYMGSFSRVGFERGRALVRVRYTPGEYRMMGSKSGALREDGKARGYTIIESIGRPGAISDQGTLDPSRLLPRSVQVSNFANQAAVRVGLGPLKAADASITESRRLIAFASIGFIESGRFISDINKTGRPAEIGFPKAGGGPVFTDRANVGATYEGADVQSPVVMGGNPSGLALLPTNQGGWGLLPGGGSLVSNTQVQVHGDLDVTLNDGLGETISAVGGIKPANDSSQLRLDVFDFDANAFNWQRWTTGNGGAFNAPQIFGSGQIDSDSGGFSTQGSLLLDGRNQEDAAGYTRMTRRKDPPSITAANPQSGLNRYLELSQRTGVSNANGTFSGEFGHGEGVYVDSSERGNRDASDLARGLDPEKSLPNDWLNPNNANSQGWQGPFYIPNAPHVQLLPDGFEIRRDGRSKNQFWRDGTGVDTGQSICRFWIRTFGDLTYVVNNISNPTFNPITATQPDWETFGRRFNGTLVFAGDVRIRGVIPTDQQLTVVSMGTIYVEGSITKGIYDRYNDGVILSPSRSVIALLAKDYVAVNTTMFFGPRVGESPKPKSTNPIPNTPNPVEIDGSSNLVFSTEFVYSIGSNDPSTWVPMASTYTSVDGSGTINSNLIATVSADDNGPTFFGLNISPRLINDPAPTTAGYRFQTTLLGAVTNGAASAYLPAIPATIPEYGLSDPTVNAYPKFESWGMPLFDPAQFVLSLANRKMEAIPANPTGAYHLAVGEPTDFELALKPVGAQPSKNGLVARMAVNPSDVRIEAAIYAQNGSFFVIPGPWFNTNPDDLRTAFEQNYTPADNTDDLNTAALDYGGGANLTLAQQRRYERYGASPDVPFYAEPLSVRLSVIGSIGENLPAPMSMQAEWLKKWGWMPRRIGGTGRALPAQHVPGGALAVGQLTVPNLLTTFDPTLATGSVPINSTPASALSAVRFTADGRTLPPAPRLPVSPTLAYFGDIIQ